MSKSLFSKYSLTDILETDDSAYAITDTAYKVLWYNPQFKSSIGLTRIKGKSLFAILEIEENELKENLPGISKPLQINNDKR